MSEHLEWRSRALIELPPRSEMGIRGEQESLVRDPTVNRSKSTSAPQPILRGVQVFSNEGHSSIFHMQVLEHLLEILNCGSTFVSFKELPYQWSPCKRHSNLLEGQF